MTIYFRSTGWLRRRSEDVVVILNNDMHFDDDFIAVMLPHFSSADVFAVSARVLDWEGTHITAGQRIGEKRRLWFCSRGTWRLDSPASRLMRVAAVLRSDVQCTSSWVGSIHFIGLPTGRTRTSLIVHGVRLEVMAH